MKCNYSTENKMRSQVTPSQEEVVVSYAHYSKEAEGFFDNDPENDNSHPLELDDTFTYCSEHDSSCSNSIIMLTPYDVYRISKRLNMEVGDFMGRYCIFAIDEKMHIPRLHINFPVGVEQCPFFDGHCSLEDEKPSVCALHPLKGTFFKVGSVNHHFYNYPNSCYSPCECKKSHKTTVREWIKSSGFSDHESIYSAMLALEMKMSNYIKEMAVRTGTRVDDPAIRFKFKHLFQLYYSILYFDYDTEKDFHTQFEKNIEFFNKNFVLQSSNENDMRDSACVKKVKYKPSNTVKNKENN